MPCPRHAATRDDGFTFMDGLGVVSPWNEVPRHAACTAGTRTHAVKRAHHARMESFDDLDMEQHWDISQALSSKPYGATNAVSLAWAPTGKRCWVQVMSEHATHPALGSRA